MGLFDFLKKKEFALIKELNSKLERYKSISDIEEETNKKRNELNKIIENKENELNKVIISKSEEINTIDNKKVKLNSDYISGLDLYTKLRKEISLYESKLDLIEFGIYEPVYDFEKSDDYRIEQNKIIEKQKELVRLEKAARCTVDWTIDGSVTKGRANTKKFIKLVLRAFNGECNSFIAKVKWNNVNQMKERIQKSFEAINKLGENSAVFIEKEYLDLKIKELILEYEFQAKRQEEKEELRAIQEELREEEKARREYEQAQREAEKEELNYQKALEKARKELDISIGDKHEKLQEQIKKLEQELLFAQEKKERALSMAQQTKRGHVYIISNIGSFGENVYKIGMTRRLEPIDRVKELGDASVPFQFDLHAMIYSDEARTLEYELHKAFADKKVNMLNYRKEFFNVTLEEIESKIAELGFEAEFTILPEAMQYRETLAILEKLNSNENVKTIEEIISEEFPNTLI
ncbi:DUF4041 domain-containing protein [Flavobacterium dankookense]|uniref:Meiotically Up-regulated Gene 113 (MUG113) protein n=1 Tax=Flavobacterium dankookense TaxID=706186 RepID=A0A4R6Q5T9_9FLAO|nr:DUF4041 domain-containing protein [Flavobacterium dankookense]TDP57768.1 Meiotically Up-regulated Gene 113 (MUG113) protein [Flavobacterium dankookense]